jgi:hypothetical protein
MDEIDVWFAYPFGSAGEAALIEDRRTRLPVSCAHGTQEARRGTAVACCSQVATPGPGSPEQELTGEPHGEPGRGGPPTSGSSSGPTLESPRRRAFMRERHGVC